MGLQRLIVRKDKLWVKLVRKATMGPLRLRTSEAKWSHIRFINRQIRNRGATLRTE